MPNNSSCPLSIKGLEASMPGTLNNKQTQKDFLFIKLKLILINTFWGGSIFHAVGNGIYDNGLGAIKLYSVQWKLNVCNINIFFVWITN